MESKVNQRRDEIAPWMESCGKYPLLTKEQTILVARRIQASEPGSKKYNKAVNKLVCHNLRLVATYVAKFMKLHPISRNEAYMTRTDLLQQGALGLLRAAQLFDPAKGYAFSTYATPWIKQSVCRYYNKCQSSVTIPESALRDSYAFTRGVKCMDRKGKPRNMKRVEETTRLVDSAMYPIAADHHNPHNDKLGQNESSLWDRIESKPMESYSSTQFSNDFESVLLQADLDPSEDELIRDMYLKQLSHPQLKEKYKLTTFSLTKKRKEAYRKIHEAKLRIG